MNVATATGVRVMRERCPTCIFRPGNLMHLQPGRVRRMLAAAARADSCIVCHSTLGDNEQAVCKGQFDTLLTAPLRLAVALDAVIAWDRPT